MALKRLASARLPQQSRFILKSKFKNGSNMYNIADPEQSIFMTRPDLKRLIPMSFASPVQTQYWDDDHSAAYREMFQRIEREGVVLER